MGIDVICILRVIAGFGFVSGIQFQKRARSKHTLIVVTGRINALFVTCRKFMWFEICQSRCLLSVAPKLEMAEVGNIMAMMSLWELQFEGSGTEYYTR